MRFSIVASLVVLALVAEAAARKTPAPWTPVRRALRSRSLEFNLGMYQRNTDVLFKKVRSGMVAGREQGRHDVAGASEPA